MKPKMTNVQVAVTMTVADWWFVLGLLSAFASEDGATHRLTDRIYEALDD